MNNSGLEDLRFRQWSLLFYGISLVLGLALFVSWYITQQHSLLAIGSYALFVFIFASLFQVTILFLKMRRHGFEQYIKILVALTLNYLAIVVAVYLFMGTVNPS